MKRDIVNLLVRSSLRDGAGGSEVVGLERHFWDESSRVSVEV